MPSMVPPGHTRGPILFMAPTPSSHQRDQLLQHFWDAAGGFGARLLLIPFDESDHARSESISDDLMEWEPDSVDTVAMSSRAAAWEGHQPKIDAATGILLLTDAPRAAAARIGGTPFAQALRRANAHGKAVAIFGYGATLLCQHMLVPPPHADLYATPQFAPGLGLVNRLTIDTPSLSRNASAQREPGLCAQRLMEAVAWNPFLVSVALDPGAGVAVYPDSTLTCFGAGTVHLAVADHNAPELSIMMHTLGRHDGYNFDAQQFCTLDLSDVPPEDGHPLSAF